MLLSTLEVALASSMLHIYLSNVALAAFTTKLDSDVQNDGERIGHAVAATNAVWHAP
jgi:hypothetical protein